MVSDEGIQKWKLSVIRLNLKGETDATYVQWSLNDPGNSGHDQGGELYCIYCVYCTLYIFLIQI